MRLLLFIAVLLSIHAAPAQAHDIAGQLRIHAFVKPEGDRLRVLVRVPLELLLNLNFPKRDIGYLDLPRTRDALPKAIAATTKELVFFADGQVLPLMHGEGRISLPSDRFESFEQAEALVRGPALTDRTDVFWNQGYFDAYLEYRIASPDAGLAVDFHVSPGLGERLKLDLRLVTASGAVRAFEMTTPSGRVELDPRWYQAAVSFAKSGFAHILDGVDHLLFLLCLILPFRRIGWTLVAVVTAFTVAHTVTLICSVYGFVPSGAWFPPLVEALIAASIIYMALENVLRPNPQRRWLVTALFGLIHGFGFSFMLKNQLQFAGDHLLLSLLAFNVGIELGQVAFIAITLPLLGLLFRSVRVSEWAVTTIISAFVAHAAWHWLTERWEILAKVEWPSVDLVTLALGVVLAAALAVLAWGLLGRTMAALPSGARRPHAK